MHALCSCASTAYGTPAEAGRKQQHSEDINDNILGWVTISRELHTSTTQTKKFHTHITFYDFENLLQFFLYLTCLLLLELFLILRINKNITC